MNYLRLALDWTPNTNHTGFFVAQHLGYYEKAEIQLSIQSPADDNYATTPAKKLEQGDTDLAIAPTESVISYRTKKDPYPMIAIAALLQRDASAVAVLESSGIERPADLDGKSYASYDARYEDEIIRQMIKNDGGEGNLQIHTPEKLGIWNTLTDGTFDATWIFTPWEGVEAENRGINLRTFVLGDYGIPYGYSPVLCTAQSRVDNDADMLASFLKATEKGFRYAMDNPQEAADILKPKLTDHDREHIDLLQSQKTINPYYTESSDDDDDGKWGVMDPEVFNAFVAWLKDHDLIPADLDAAQLFSNKCLNS
jgi:ABC-type nitrate/sulfonate/bicarbonate transport system substrate-binding protein